MKSFRKPVRTLVSAAVITLLSSHPVIAGSFSLYTEGSAAAIGNYAAGIAAEAADASTSWYNPAGLPLLSGQQMVAGGIGVMPNTKITGTSRFSMPPLPDFVQSFNNLNGRKNALIPTAHYALPLGENAAFGLSLVAPFGLATDWSERGPVRYAATYSKLVTATVSPALGARITDNFSVGLGVDLQYSKVKFNRVLGSPVFASAIAPFIGNPPASFLDSTSSNKGQSTGVGFHGGVLFTMNDNHSRVGANYQSNIKHRFHGSSTLAGLLASPGLNIANPASLTLANPAARFNTNNLRSNEIEFPDIVTVSGYQDINNTIALLGSVVYTGWSSLKTIQLNNVAAFVPAVGQTPVNSISTQFYRDTWRFAGGVNYRVNDQWLMRVGGGYDQTPTNNANRDIRIADSNRWALSVGTHYQARPNIGLDAGYTHLFSVSDVPVNKTDTVGTGSTYTIAAQAKGSADLVGLQVNWLMDAPAIIATK